MTDGELRARAIVACREWSRARIHCVLNNPLREQHQSIDLFDQAMFALGEIAYGSQGEIGNVVKRDREGGEDE